MINKHKSRKIKKAIKKDIKKNTFRYESYSIWVNDSYNNDNFIKFVTNIESEFGKSEIIKNGRNTLVKVDKNPDFGIRKAIVIKRFNLKRKYDKLRFRFLKSKAYRSLTIALALQKIHIKTPSPVAIIDKRDRFNGLIFSYYISEYIHYDYSFGSFLNSSREYEDNKIREYVKIVASQIRKIHNVGIIHNDLNLHNILIVENDGPQIYYIDLNRARIRKILPLGIRIHDLTRISFKIKFQKILFCKTYDPPLYKIVYNLLYCFTKFKKYKHYLKKEFRRLKIFHR